MRRGSARLGGAGDDLVGLGRGELLPGGSVMSAGRRAVVRSSIGIRCPRPAPPAEPGGGPSRFPLPAYASPNSLAISIRWTSLVPSPISRILESRHIRATGYSFMKP